MTTQFAYSTQVDSHRVNGVDLNVLKETIKVIKEDPEMGVCKFKASNTWSSGAHNVSKVAEFYGAKQTIPHKQTFSLHADEPAILAGNDQGANPVEHLLHGLASCLTTSLVAHAAVRGIEIDELESELEGDLDLNGFLGLLPDTPKGFTQIRVNFKIKAGDEDMKVLRTLPEFSPVFNTLVKGVPVDVTIHSKD